jgi:Na+:H+ antiporter, NhaA family
VPDRLSEAVHDGDHVRGVSGAPLELVMYGDFECPFCAASQGILERVHKRLGDELRFVFRHFPIEEVHPHAQLAAQASEAAAAQGAFWEMHDALYAARGALEERDLIRHAAALGLDADRVAQELRDGVHAARVAHDAATGRASGIVGTPGFYANGLRVEGAFDAGSLVEALRDQPGR